MNSRIRNASPRQPARPFRFAKGLLVACCLPLFNSCGEEAPPHIEAPVAVKVFEVGQQATGQSRRLSGKVLAAERSQLSFRVSGQVAEIMALQGQAVTQGQLLARLDAKAIKIKVSEARADLSNAQAQQVEAQAVFNRTQQLLEKRAASQKDLDTATANLAAADSNMQSTAGALSRAELDLSYASLTAPFSGQIVEVPIQAFQEVSASEVAVVLQSEGALEIEVRVPETLIREVDFGQTVQVAFPTLPGTTIQGTVIEIGVEAEAGSAFRVAVRLAQSPAHLLPGMSASVTFTYSAYLDGKQAFMIPLAAVALDQALIADANSADSTAKRAPVFVFNPATSQVQLRQVTFGDFRGNEAEVYEGLNKGDLVVSAGVPFLRDGMKVSIWSPRK